MIDQHECWNLIGKRLKLAKHLSRQFLRVPFGFQWTVLLQGWNDGVDAGVGIIPPGRWWPRWWLSWSRPCSWKSGSSGRPPPDHQLMTYLVLIILLYERPVGRDCGPFWAFVLSLSLRHWFLAPVMLHKYCHQQTTIDKKTMDIKQKWHGRPPPCSCTGGGRCTLPPRSSSLCRSCKWKSIKIKV